MPGVNLLALLLMETVTVVLSPTASDEPVEDKLSHVCTFDAVQLIELPPVLVRVYVLLDGLNGPPSVPEALSPSAGVTERATGVASTGKLIVRAIPAIVNCSPLEPVVIILGKLDKVEGKV